MLNKITSLKKGQQAVQKEVAQRRASEREEMSVSCRVIGKYETIEEEYMAMIEREEG